MLSTVNPAQQAPDMVSSMLCYSLRCTESTEPERGQRMADNSEHTAAVAKYVDSPEQVVVDRIVGYCGIALRSKDASMVSATDPKELETVRKGFARKKLELDEAAATAGIEKVCARMKGDGRKHRVAFYYLLADETGTLDKLR